MKQMAYRPTPERTTPTVLEVLLAGLLSIELFFLLWMVYLTTPVQP